jgi:hypothetical protein
MTSLLTLTGAALIATGVPWWKYAGVSAERPASLLCFIGAVGIVAPFICRAMGVELP